MSHSAVSDAQTKNNICSFTEDAYEMHMIVCVRGRISEGRCIAHTRDGQLEYLSDCRYRGFHLSYAHHYGRSWLERTYMQSDDGESLTLYNNKLRTQ